MIVLGELAALFAAILWAFNSIVLTNISSYMGTVNANLARLIFASFFLLITVIIIGAPMEISGYQYTHLITSGIIGLIFGDTFMLKSYVMVGPRIGMLMMSLAPPISAVLAYFFLQEELTILTIIGICVTLVGVGIVILDKKQSNIFGFSALGIFYGFLAAAGQAIGLIFAKNAFNAGELNEFSATLVRLASSTLLMYVVALAAGKAKNLFRKLKNDRYALKNSILASILGPYLGITLSMVAIVYTKVGIASTLMATVPVLMLPISKYYYKETLTWQGIVGAFIAVIGVALLFIY